MVEALERLDLAFPKVEGDTLREMMQVKKALLAEEKPRRKGRMPGRSTGDRHCPPSGDARDNARRRGGSPAHDAA